MRIPTITVRSEARREHIVGGSPYDRFYIDENGALQYANSHCSEVTKNGPVIIGGQGSGKSFLFCEKNIHIATDDSGWIHIVPESEPVMQSEIVMDPSADLLSKF